MRILILGGGVIGVTSAWYLAAAGHDVTVVERQPAVARETSFANGGQISVSHAEPWANPGALRRIVAWLGREDAPLLWRWRADAAQFGWGLRFLRECTAARTHENIHRLITLGLYSRQRLAALRGELDLQYQQELRGILHIYTDAAEHVHAVRQAGVMQQFGCDRRPLSAAECVDLEPALGDTDGLVGGTYTRADESGDARLFTEKLADAATKRGVRFLLDTSLTHLQREGGCITGARVRKGDHEDYVAADCTIVALGSYSREALSQLGVRIPVYPAKGYSATFALNPEMKAPRVSLTDDGHKLVFSRLGERLRVAGTAEFNGYDLSLNATRCEAIRSRVVRLFPDLAGVREIEYWAGLRPATPSNVPLIGPTGVPGLWLNTGHGTLGWTLACGSGQLLADLIDGRTPGVTAAWYSPSGVRPG